MKKKWIDAHLDTAHRYSQLSYARRLKVGAIIVKEHKIISIGYNGTPEGWDNNCEDEEVVLLTSQEHGQKLLSEGWQVNWLDNKASRLVTKAIVLHGEENAIIKLAKTSGDADGATLFCTHSCCLHCAKLIYGAGIKEMYFRQVYRNTEGVDFLKQCGINVEQISK